MFAIGLQCAGSAFLAAGFKVQLAIALTVLWLVIFLCAHLRDRDDAPVTFPGFSLLNILHFFFRRLDFLNDGFRTTGQPIFQFNLLTVLVLEVILFLVKT
jgi:sterol 14-demethylase